MYGSKLRFLLKRFFCGGSSEEFIKTDNEIEKERETGNESDSDKEALGDEEGTWKTWKSRK